MCPSRQTLSVIDPRGRLGRASRAPTRPSGGGSSGEHRPPAKGEVEGEAEEEAEGEAKGEVEGEAEEEAEGGAKGECSSVIEAFTVCP